MIHLAAMNAQSCQNHPEDALLVNGLGSLNLLKAAGANGVKRFIYFSTAHIYGATLEGTIDEDTLPRPHHPYSITHRLAEDYVMEAARKDNLDATIFRLSNAVGSPLSHKADCWMLAVNDLVRQVVLKNEMRFRSPGSIERDFIPISDVCKAVTFIMDRHRGGDLYNLGSGHSMSLRELAGLIADVSEKVLGRRPGIIFPDTKTESLGAKGLTFSNNKIIEAGFEFENDLEEEIGELIRKCREWF